MISKTTTSRRRSKSSLKTKPRMLNKTITKLTPTAKSTYFSTSLNRCSRSSKRKRRKLRSRRTLSLSPNLIRKKTMMYCLLIERTNNSVKTRRTSKPEMRRMVLAGTRTCNSKLIAPPRNKVN